MTTVIGRESDLQRVQDALRRSGACAIVGPGGVGKSTLMSAVVGRLGERAILIDADVMVRPDQLLAALALRLDVDHVIDTGADDISHVCLQLAERLSAAGVELLAVDHVDGTGGRGMDALARLAAESVDLMVLVATRNHPVRPFGEVARLLPLAVGAVGDSTHSASAELFRDTFVCAGGEPDVLDGQPNAVHQILESSGGLPLAIIVLASQAALVGLERASLIGDSADVDVGSTPGSDVVGAALQRSLGDLDEEAQRVFRAIGAFRSDPLPAQIAAIAGLSISAVTTAVERLARRSLVDVAGGRTLMLPPVRQLADRTARLNGERALLERRLVQWAHEMARADPSPSTTAVLAVEDDLIRAIASSLGEDRLDLTISVATVLDDAFRADLRHRRRVEILEPVLSACEEASKREPGDRERIDDLLDMMRAAAMAHADVGHGATATRLLSDAAQLIGRSSRPDLQLARIESLRAGLSFESGDLAAAHRDATSAIDRAERAGDDSVRHRATKVLADVALESGELEHALALANAIVREASPSSTVLRGYALATVGACELERGAISVASAAARQVAADAGARGSRDLLVEADWLSAMADPGCPPARRIELEGDRIGNSVIHIQADIAAALRQLAAGAPGAAILLAADCELRANSLPMRPLAIDAQLLVGAAAVELGSVAEATRAYRQALTDAVDLGFRLRVADALDGLADVWSILGHRHPDPKAVRGAAAAIRSHLGAVARPAPWRSAGATSLRRPPPGWVARGVLSEAGLQALLSVLAGSGPATAVTTDRLAPLSPAERAVADLVADGHTNREIGEMLYVSRRTVETHVAHAFQKLDVRSRTQLAAIVLDERQR